jgi:membrane protein implicated in regulation of membrane protease activity
MDPEAAAGAGSSTTSGGAPLVDGQEAVYLGAWDFVLLFLLALVLLWVLPKRLLRALQRRSWQARRSASGVGERKRE